MTDSLLGFTLTVFMGFFAIMNPIANLPIYIGLVANKSEKARKRIAKKASMNAFIIVLVFTLMGKFIFEFFGITIPAFKITGGILIFYIGFEMLLSRKSQIHSNEDTDADDSIAISPLAIPILAGPGTIVTAMNYTTDATFSHIGIVIAMFALMIFLTYLSFSSSRLIIKYLGENVINVIGKLMGLILAIIGTGMLTEGIKLSFDL